MIAHELYESRRICFPIHREAFQIFKGGADSHTREKRNGIFGVLVEISVKNPLVHEIRLARDVKENPSQVMQLEGCKSRRIFRDRFLNRFSIFADCLFSTRLDFCDDSKAIIRGSSWKEWPIPALLGFEVALFG